MTDPLQLGQTANLNTWGKNWSQRYEAIQNSPLAQSDEWKNLAKYDLSRVKNGQSPLSDQEAAMGLMALRTGHQIIPQPENNSVTDYIFNNPVSDLKNILTGLPKMPGAILHEAEQLPEAPAAISQALETPGGLKEKIAAVTEAPGVRLLPGSYTLHNIAAGTPEELAKHPISTFLDVLPYAEKTGLVDMANQALEPYKEKAGRFFQEKGLGGAEARETMRQASMAGRGLSDATQGIQRMVLDKFDELGIPQELGPDYMKWAELDRQAGVPAPDPRFDQLAQYQDELNQITNAKGLATGHLVEHNGEMYSANSPMGQQLGQQNKRISSLIDRMGRLANKETHWTERSAADEARLNQLLQTGTDTPQVVGALGDTTQRWAQQVGPQMLGEMESALPPAPGSAPLPLRPGEVAWGEGVRHGEAQPEVTRTLPYKYKDVRFENGQVNSDAMDKLQQGLSASDDAMARVQNDLMMAQARAGLDEPVRAQLNQQLKEADVRLDNAQAVTNTQSYKDLEERAKTVNTTGLTDQLNLAGEKLTGEQGNQYNQLLRQLDKTGSYDAARQIYDTLRQEGLFTGDQRTAADAAAQTLRNRLGDAESAKVELGRYPTEESLAPWRTAKADAEARLAELGGRSKQTADLTTELDRLQQDRAKLELAHEREVARLGKVSEGIKVTEGLDPHEAELQAAYRAMDAYDRGEYPSVRAALDQRPFGQGVTNIEQIRAIAKQREDEGWTAPPPREKGQAIRRGAAEQSAYSKTEQVAAHTKAQAAYDRLFGEYGLAYQAQGAIGAGDIKEATRLMTKTVNEAKKLAAAVPEAYQLQAFQLVDELKAIRADTPRIPSLANKVSAATDRLAASRERAAQLTGHIEEVKSQIEEKRAAREKLVFDTPPARYIPKLNAMMRDEIYQRFNPTNDPDIGMKLQLGAWKDLMPQNEIDALYRSYARHWQDIRDGGFDPKWEHHVPPNKAYQVTRTNLALDHEPTPSSVKARAMDMADHMDSPEIAMTHQLLEWEQRHWTENFLWGGDGVPGIMNNKLDGGRAWTNEQVIDKYAEEIVGYANKHGLTIEQARDRFIGRHFTTLDPFQFTPWAPTARIKTLGRTAKIIRANGEEVEVPRTVLVPKATEKVIRSMIPRSGGPGFAYTAYNKAMNVFRVSALAFSPRFQVYNTLGGAMLLTARTDPGVFRYWSAARDMVGGMKDFVMKGELPKGMPLELSRGGAVAPEFATRLKTDPVAMVRFEQGKFFGKLWGKVENVASKSFALNEWVDNMYRSMAYLYGQDKALTAGMSRAEAVDAGIKLSNKILQDWDVMLPWERTVLRNVLPFYGWMKHIATYTFTYPFDHPMRASILSAIVRTETGDAQSALPDKFRQILWMGEPDANGKQLTFGLAGLNPFNDVADMFTLAGFISQISPAGQAVLEGMNVDLANARSSLFPDTTYDPQTGRIIATGKSPLESVLTSFIPQAQTVMGLAGVSSEMRLLKQRNPDAWASRIMVALGVPFSPRVRSMTEEITRAELARDSAATTALRTAMKTGDWSDALRYQAAQADLTGKGTQIYSPAKVKEYIDQAQEKQKANALVGLP